MYYNKHIETNLAANPIVRVIVIQNDRLESSIHLQPHNDYWVQFVVLPAFLFS